MNFQITVRHGRKIQRYLTLQVEAPDAAQALRNAADLIPEEVVLEVDIVELRTAPERDREPPLEENL